MSLPPLTPQKSWVCILAIMVGLSGSGIGTRLSVPVPPLSIWVKFKTENVCATPARGM